MSNYKNNQEAFLAAERGVKEAKDQYEVAKWTLHTASGGREISHLKNEVSEAMQQVEKALMLCSDTQHERLKVFQSDLQFIKDNLDQMEQLM